MRKKPKGRKYRNLYARGSSIVYERIVGGRRIKRSLGVDDWSEATAVRDALEEKIGTNTLPRIAVPSFGEAAEAVLSELSHLAATTRDDREAMLAEDGPIVTRFGVMQLDAIRRPDLLDWWGEFVNQGGRSQKTGRNYLDAMSSVFVWAQERELIDENHVDGLRAILRRRNRTQRGRAESEAGRKVNPIEEPGHVAALVQAAEGEAEGTKSHLVTLLMLDAGLRIGEATAVGWEDVDRKRRSLRVRASLSRGKHLGRTKSGRERPVALSRRLLAALQEAWMAEGRPVAGPVARVDHANYRNRVLPRICKAAEIGEGFTPHCLRDTFASQLLSTGVQLAYVSHQLGHADVAVTARHYARWCGDEAYREPVRLAQGDVPADLLAQLGEESRQTHVTPAEASTAP